MLLDISENRPGNFVGMNDHEWVLTMSVYIIFLNNRVKNNRQ